MFKNIIESWQIKAVKETYHKFPTKGITKEMLKASRNESHLRLTDCKRILLDYIEELSRKY